MTQPLADNRAEIERLLREAYAARQRGDVPAILSLFSNDVRFRIAGTPEPGGAVGEARGQEQLGSMMAGLVKTFELLDHKIISMLVEGDGATVHWRATFRSTVTGETAETELVDVVKFKDGRVTSFLEFCDTALAARMMGK